VARVNPALVARWVVDAGWSGADAVTATAVGVATGADPAAQGGVFGVAGPANDGPGQARAARELVQQSGWDVLPAHRTGRYVLYLPIATASVATLAGVETAKDLPNPITAAGEAKDAAQQLVDTLTAPVRTLAYLGTAEAQERLAKFMIGTALVVVGGIIFARRFAKQQVDKVSSAVGDVGSEVLAFRLAQSSGAKAGAAAGAAAAPAPTSPEPRREPPPRAERSPWYNARHRADDEPKTTELNPLVAKTRGLLGEQEAISQGHAPARGRA
jgi:hypothetical protein